jgi:hypothetical protein
MVVQIIIIIIIIIKIQIQKTLKSKHSCSDGC